MKRSEKMVCVFLMFLLLSTNLVLGMVNAENKNQSNNLIPVISVSGGLGINIEIEGATEETSIVITLEGALVRFISRQDHRDSINIDVGIIDFGSFLDHPDDFKLHISVGNNVYSYDCKSFFFVFAFGFSPI